MCTHKQTHTNTNTHRHTSFINFQHPSRQWQLLHNNKNEFRLRAGQMRSSGSTSCQRATPTTLGGLTGSSTGSSRSSAARPGSRPSTRCPPPTTTTTPFGRRQATPRTLTVQRGHGGPAPRSWRSFAPVWRGQAHSRCVLGAVWGAGVGRSRGRPRGRGEGSERGQRDGRSEWRREKEIDNRGRDQFQARIHFLFQN